MNTNDLHLDVTEELITLLRGRQKKGIAHYGTTLKTNNGRVAMQDALEESLDLNQYLMQMYLESRQMLGYYMEKVRRVRDKADWEVDGDYDTDDLLHKLDGILSICDE